MSKNLQSPTKLTEFAPLQPEERPQSVGQFISKFFKISRTEEPLSTENAESVQEVQSEWKKEGSETPERTVSSSFPSVYDVYEERSLPYVMKRINSLLAGKTNNLQDYGDTELKQYWMPDSVSKECYHCSEKFTTFRRRHHCRVCGQIFCSQCCSQHIPGKIFGCTGDLRVCSHCCKAILTYLQSTNLESSDLKELQENLQSKFGNSLVDIQYDELLPTMTVKQSDENVRRKISVGYQEETFGSGSSPNYLTNDEKCKALQNSTSLRNLFEELCRPLTGLNFIPYKYRLRTYPECFLGSELVDWLICQQKAKTRIQASALAQALLEGSYIEAFSDNSTFVDGYVRYRKGNLFNSNSTQLNANFYSTSQEEPVWLRQIPQEAITDSDEPISPQLKGFLRSNSYMLDLNVEASSVYLSRPTEPSLQQNQENDLQQCKHEEEIVIRTSDQRELAPESGWFHVPTLREENSEKEAYELLSEAYLQHEQSLLKQLLSTRGLSSSWIKILIPLARDIITFVTPDKKQEPVIPDIRNYVQIKKLPGGKKEDTCLVGGIVCSKHVIHKEMAVEISNPRILLLQCSIVYQRTEGKLMSLEPVMMQEHEYLRHVTSRIAALRPDVVLVHKNISRLAQDMLRKHKITIVQNVKKSVLDRLAICTQADFVTAVDAQIGRPNLGTCEKFYLKSFNTERGGLKTLMFFDGLPLAHLGATILLRGASKAELTKVKEIASFMIFAAYNWRLEKSFLMDEFALPPNPRMEFFDDSRDSSPQETKPMDIIRKDNQDQSSKPKPITDEKKPILKRLDIINDPLQSTPEPKKITVESVIDNSDPLNQINYDNIVKNNNDNKQVLTVAELPLSNNFKKHLDDTILCVSPYIIFPVPYLETEAGRKCKLRRFFEKDFYYSEQFETSVKSRRRNLDDEAKMEVDIRKKMMTPAHPFLTAKITDTENPKIQNLLAHFRAVGGQYVKKDVGTVTKAEPVEVPPNEKCRMDVLDPMNHQRLPVLFYSFSHESNNSPGFCYNPDLIYMDFYGNNDIQIGNFLQRYCFQPLYICRSESCGLPMEKHIRRYVHNSGVVTLTINNSGNKVEEENIVMWSCCSKCPGVSPAVALETDSWSYSFAKYLQLRFHGDLFTRRGRSPCQHSLHHDHFHYFGYRNYVASFKYSPISIWEISLPCPEININYDFGSQHSNLIENSKFLAQKGHELFSHIQDKLSIITCEELEGVGNIRQALTMQQASFKQKVEEIQLKLTSPSIEYKEFDERAVREAHWKIQDNFIKQKASVVELVDSWNSHLNEFFKKSDKKKEKNSVPDLESPINEVTDKSFLERERKMELERSSSAEEATERGQSDISSTQIEESTDSKREVMKKEMSVKNILDKILPSSGQLNLIQSIFPSQEHYAVPSGVYGTIPVYENEISSIIAHALNSHDYKKSFEELTRPKIPNTEHSPSPTAKRKNNLEKEKSDDEKASGLLGFLRNKESKGDIFASPLSGNRGETTEQPTISPEKPEEQKKGKNLAHIEIQFQDNCCTFFCKVYFADKFTSLRQACFPLGEQAYIRSLSRSIQWKAKGGKSGSNFAKTKDDRFIIKEIPAKEEENFLESSSSYFTYMNSCHKTGKPSLLAKIVGIYQIGFKNSSDSRRTSVLVMENIFYNREVKPKFDLKGTNRSVVPKKQEGEIVLLDGDLLKMTCDKPLYVLSHSKDVLLRAIHNDTEYLSNQSVMDYSLIVGLDTQSKELVLGIIDYIRIYTWDKKLETFVKGVYQDEQPTIISPKEYQKRFIDAMYKYFLEVPDQFKPIQS